MRNLSEFLIGYNVKTQVLIERGLIQKVAEHLKKICSGGCVVVCGDSTLPELTEKIQRNLSDNGFVVRRIDVNPESKRESLAAFSALSDGVKHYLAVGGGTVCDLVKIVAKLSGDKYSVIPTAPSTEGYITPYAELSLINEWEQCDTPELIMVDYDLLEECPEELLSAGYGRVANWWIKVFDLKYNGVVDGLQMTNVVNELSEELVAFLTSPPLNDFCAGLFEMLLKIGAAASEIEIISNSVENFIGVNFKERLQGENSFLIAYVKQNLYKCFLKNEVTDTLLPPDIIKTLKLVEKNCGWEYNNFLKNTANWDKKDYFKRSFVLSEYRADLLNELMRVDLSASSRVWRRLYRDAGYWIKNYLPAARLMRLISLSAEYSGGLIKDIKHKGFLESYI